jgi:hypothetical protein
MQTFAFTKASMESFYINFKPFIYKIIMDLSLKLTEKLESINIYYTPEKLVSDQENLITSLGGITTVQDGLFNCGI